MQLRAPTILVLFWTTILLPMWCAGCTPMIVRCVVEPTAAQRQWMVDVTERSNDHETRILELERAQREREGI